MLKDCVCVLVVCGACGPVSQPANDLSSDMASTDIARPPLAVSQLTNSSTSTPAVQNITQWNWAHQVAVDNLTVHVAFTKLFDLNIEYPADKPDPVAVGALPEGQIIAMRSTDGGQTFSAEVPLSAKKAGIDSANIAVSGNHAYAAWREPDGGRWRVAFRHSADAGVTWDPQAFVSDNPVGIGVSPPSLTTSLSSTTPSVYVVWADGRGLTKEIFLASSDDHGATWNAVRPVSSTDSFSSWTPSVAAAGNTVHVGWTDDRHNVGDCTLTPNPCKEEEYYRRSTNGGLTWDAEVRLTSDAQGMLSESWAPSLAAWNDSVHFAYLDRRSGAFQIYYRRSTDAGATWKDEAQLSTTQFFTNSARPTVAVRAGNVHLAWFAFDTFEADLIYLSSTDDGATFGPPQNLTGDVSSAARIPSITAGPGTSAHLIWYDTRLSAPAVGQRVEIFYARIF